MKAIVYARYGSPDVLRLTETETPAPAAGEILILIRATTVNRTDCGMRSAQYFVSRIVTGLTAPRRKVAGSEFAGDVVGLGAGVTGFAVGDRVFGFEDVRSGAHAEYMAQAAGGSVAKIPDSFSYQEAAPAGEGATYALNVIRASGVRKGQKALVYGASGAIGSAAVQILVHMGVAVTAVCGTRAMGRVAPLGAGTLIDYERQDFTRTDERFHLVFDAVGKSSYGACRKLLAAGGRYCSTELGAGMQNPWLALWFALAGSRRVIFPIPMITKEKAEHIRGLMEAGAYRPLIDRTYPLEDIAEAARYVESGQKIGNVVITVA